MADILQEEIESSIYTRLPWLTLASEESLSAIALLVFVFYDKSNNTQVFSNFFRLNRSLSPSRSNKNDDRTWMKVDTG